MKHFYLLFLAIFAIQISHAQIIDIPDADFKDDLVNGYCTNFNGGNYGNTDVDTNDDGEIQVSEALAITFLNISSENINDLEGLQHFTNLTYLNCSSNPFNSINLSALVNLEALYINSYNLTSLDISNLTNLKILGCEANLNSIDLTALSNLESINLSNNNFSTLDLSQNQNLDYISLGNNNFSTLDISQNTNLTTIRIQNTPLISLDVSQHPNLEDLRIENNQIAILTLNQNNGLTHLQCSNNPLSSLDLSQTPNLENLNISGMPLLNYDLSHVPNLTSLTVSNNNFTSLDLSGLTNLTSLNCSSNQLTSMDLSQMTNLINLNCRDNHLTELNVSQLNNLRSINFSDNLLTTFDSNGINTIRIIYAENNLLETVFLKDGYSGGYYDFFEYLTEYRFQNNPLQYICVDSFGWEANYLSQYISSSRIGTYCSFVPGGDFYTIEGNNRLDLDINGCDVSDDIYPSLKINITDGTNNATFISNASGDYTIPVQAGIHTITPELENSDYFTISPTSYVVDFPTDASPLIQDFCITPNGTHNDLEVTILPLGAARPGFDSNYKLVYKNKGNTTLSGSINLTFQDEVMDLISANPTADSQTIDNLSWNYGNLQPFESRYILITMNLNTPTETPPLVGGEELDFTAIINPDTSDETPQDNVSSIKQLVVNSFDPNDKTCLEGDTITPEMVGKDLHYLIRFENTGTANAINVVVKDEIVTSRFDISTLLITDSSHEVVTRVKNSNLVEFIFENIDLPFDDANNDGYVAFKIKTLPTLLEGYQIWNRAKIYFDYNAPIQTNTALTTIEAPLSVNTFELTDLEIYPNPVQDILNIKGKDAIKSITMYDISGRLINQVSFIGHQTDVSISTEQLSQGTYFAKVKTEGGEGVRKIIKK